MWGSARCSSSTIASRISRSPGRNTSTSPRGSSSVISLTVLATASARSVLVVARRAIEHVDRVRATRDLDHRRAAEERRKPLGLERRRADDDAEVRAARQQPLEEAEQEIDVEAALVRLVDDDRVVRAQQRIALDLGEQDPVGHELHVRCALDLSSKRTL